MPPDQVSDPNTVVLSRELYNLILRAATLPVLLLLIALSWYIINWLMNSDRRQERRNREIRKAVAARKALMAAHQEQGLPDTTSSRQYEVANSPAPPGSGFSNEKGR